MLFLARLKRMFWQRTRDRRQSSPADRAEFESRKRETEQEREQVEQRLRFLHAEASLYSKSQDSDQKR